jgi:ATP-dependent DNA helicase RecQ
VDSPAPVIKNGSTWQRTPVAYQMDHEHIRRLSEQREMEWREVQTYIDGSGCLMEFLAQALDDADPQPCGKCASCLGTPVIDAAFTRATAVSAARFLRQSEIALECNKQVAKDAFAEYGFRGNLPQGLRAETGRILSRWGDAGWGQLVADGKHSGHFPDELVDAVVEMIRDRWRPTPPPAWITCVPSRNHPALVPDFGERLARALGLPFLPVVIKAKDNELQKVQQNRFHQCRNLDGVFGIEREVPDGSVLLIDDVVDSGWTLTVVAALLRQAGSGPVWPLALATSSIGA